MSETHLIADEIDRAAHGGAWHGPAIEDAMKGVTGADARARPIAGAHTIWEIALHMSAWATEVGRRLRENARPLAAEADWPLPTGEDEAAWSEARSELVEAHRRLRLAIREFPPGRLNEPVPGTPDNGHDSFYVMLHGLAQHDAYHAGQIAVLKKALAASEQHAAAARVGVSAIS